MEGEEMESMFDSVSEHYDSLNHILSFGIDRVWRRRAARIMVRQCSPQRVLDVAAGTGDLSLAAVKAGVGKVTGLDLSLGMLERGKNKIERQGYGSRIELVRGDALDIRFDDNSFDAVMSAFGVRNFSDTLRGLAEMCRVTRPGGMVMILEFSKPSWYPFREIYGLYFKKVLPRIGKSISGATFAYTYLPDSVMLFPENKEFLGLMERAGYSRLQQRRMTGGIVSIYTGFKL